MLAGSVIGVPGPVATTRPPWTWRLSTAVGGRYRPTLVRSSPSSGAMSTRSPTTIRRLGDSSGMGSSIHPRAPAGLARGGNGDVDHVPRLTGPGAALLMRPCRSGSRGPHSPFHSEGTTDMQSPTVQTEQWSWILQTVWGWIWGGLSWIVDWQAYVFRLVLSGHSFWEVVGKVLLLLFPTFALVAGVWGTVVSLYTIPFRLGHSARLLTALLMSWWDAARMCWFYWVGMARFLLVLVGSIWGLLRLGAGLIWGTLKSVVMSPFTLLDSTSRQPGVPWIAFMLLIFWSMIEATIIDQKMSSMKAIHGTPGWRDVESSRVNGDMTTLFKVPQMSPAPSLSNPQIEPTSTRRKRAMPTQ